MVDSGGGQVEGGDAVAGGLEERKEFEPGPCTMAGSVDEDEVFVKMMRVRSIIGEWELEEEGQEK